MLKFQTKSDIESLLTAAGVRPRRRWGQNFLIDGNLLRRLLQSAELRPDDIVLEVGAGTGSLTEHLAAEAGAVVSVEIDPRLSAITAQRLAGADNVTMITDDVLMSKHRVSPRVIRALADAREQHAGRLLLVANLPFNVATPLLINLLLEPCAFDRFCFTVQSEVADRMVAVPGTKDYGPVSVMLQSTCCITRLAELPPAVFWPVPKVCSTMLRAEVVRNPFETPGRLAGFAKLLQGAFAHRRKMLKHNLPQAVGGDMCPALSEHVDLKRRAESLSVDEWVDLGRRVESLRS